MQKLLSDKRCFYRFFISDLNNYSKNIHFRGYTGSCEFDSNLLKCQPDTRSDQEKPFLIFQEIAAAYVQGER